MLKPPIIVIIIVIIITIMPWLIPATLALSDTG